jgi:hypothetical protein
MYNLQNNKTYMHKIKVREGKKIVFNFTLIYKHLSRFLVSLDNVTPSHIIITVTSKRARVVVQTGPLQS